MKHRYFIYLSYNGAAYCGWQIQPNGISVQERLEKAIGTIFRNTTEVTAAGRTDAGVHASTMVAHVDFEEELTDINHLITKLNSYLPSDICIEQIVKVKPDAHARFDAVYRKYEYHVSLKKDVFNAHLSMRVFQSLNFEAMNQAAETLFDYSDFTSFSKLHTDTKTNNCKVTHAKWTPVDENHWVFTIQADRFLRNMVRAIVGTLLEVGREKITVNDFKNIIEQKDRCKAGTSVPAQGLFLTQVSYPDTIFVKAKDE
ncbi:MAG: tRNA pseudouridine(38-40) synthase TruA [Paludibacteraceae bacterium]